jgi:hypothetical protein
MGVHAILAGERHLEQVPDGDLYILQSIQDFSEKIDFDPNMKGLKWRYARRLMNARCSAWGAGTWAGMRDAGINALMVLSAVMETADFSASGFINPDDAIGISAAVYEFSWMRDMFQSYLNKRGVSALSARYLLETAKDLTGLKMTAKDLHWKRLKEGVLETFKQAVERYADLNRFIENIAESAEKEYGPESRLMVYTKNMDQLPKLPADYLFSIQRFIDDLFDIAHKLGTSKKPIVMKIGWKEGRSALEIETPGDSRLFNIVMGDHENAEWLREGNGDWWIEHINNSSYRVVLPLRPVDYYSARQILEERKANKIIQGFRRLRSELEGGSSKRVNLEFAKKKNVLIVKNSDRLLVDFIWNAYERSNPHLMPTYVRNMIGSSNITMSRNAGAFRVPLMVPLAVPRGVVA